MILAPVLVLWGVNPRHQLDPSRDIEVSILLVLMVFLSEVVFGGWLSISALNYPVAFILAPIIVWTALIGFAYIEAYAKRIAEDYDTGLDEHGQIGAVQLQDFVHLY